MSTFDTMLVLFSTGLIKNKSQFENYITLVRLETKKQLCEGGGG